MKDCLTWFGGLFLIAYLVGEGYWLACIAVIIVWVIVLGVNFRRNRSQGAEEPRIGGPFGGE